MFERNTMYDNSNVVCFNCFDWPKAKLKENLHFSKFSNIHTHVKSVTSLKITSSIYYSKIDFQYTDAVNQFEKYDVSLFTNLQKK
jgi:hypothetical protein